MVTKQKTPTKKPAARRQATRRSRSREDGTGIPDGGAVQLLFGEIETDVAAEVCAWILNACFEEERPKHLTLLINSEGGNLAAAFAIIECMRSSPIPIHTVALGNICSAGLFIFMSGKKGHRTITPTCSIMSHNYSTGIAGNHHELVAIQKELNYTHQRILEHFKRCTGLSEKAINERLIGVQDSWMSPQEAIDLKIGDRISEI